jgi:hypothetical protein
MCLACEQDAIWLAYLESRGLLKADDPDAVEALFAAFPVQPLPMRDGEPEQVAGATASAAGAGKSGENPFSCDDPTADEADSNSLQQSIKPD